MFWSSPTVIVPIDNVISNLLSSFHSKRRINFVFPNADNSPIKDLNRRLWKRITISSGLYGLRFHDLRHNWASRHAESGTDLLAIKELGGWKTLEMVPRYTHPSLGYLSKQANNTLSNKDRGSNAKTPKNDKK